MKTLKLTIPLALYCATTLIRCKPDSGNSSSGCDPAKITTYNLTQSDLNRVPYNGNETLKFYTQSGDTVLLTGKGKYMGYDVKTEVGGNPECDPDEERRQYSIVSFGSVNQLLNFSEVRVSMGGGLEVRFGVFRFLLDAQDINTKDSIVIDSNKYLTTKAYSFVYNSIGYPDFQHIDYKTNFVYYNNIYGILKIELRDGTILLRKL